MIGRYEQRFSQRVYPCLRAAKLIQLVQLTQFTQLENSGGTRATEHADIVVG
jgi:hypothetical protein